MPRFLQIAITSGIEGACARPRRPISTATLHPERESVLSSALLASEKRPRPQNSSGLTRGAAVAARGDVTAWRQRWSRHENGAPTSPGAVSGPGNKPRTGQTRGHFQMIVVYGNGDRSVADCVAGASDRLVDRPPTWSHVIRQPLDAARRASPFGRCPLPQRRPEGMSKTAADVCPAPATQPPPYSGTYAIARSDRATSTLYKEPGAGLPAAADDPE